MGWIGSKRQGYNHIKVCKGSTNNQQSQIGNRSNPNKTKSNENHNHVTLNDNHKYKHIENKVKKNLENSSSTHSPNTCTSKTELRLTQWLEIQCNKVSKVIDGKPKSKGQPIL